MFGGKFNIMDLMKNAHKMQEMLGKAQEEMAKIDVVGEAGAGAIKIVMNARHYVKSVSIDNETLKEPKEIIEGLIAAAVNDASQKIEEVVKGKMGDAGRLFGGESS